MPAFTGARKRSDPTGQDRAAQCLSTRVEELQAEIDALRRENEHPKRIKRDPGEGEDYEKDHMELDVIYTSAPIGLCLISPDTRYLRVNRQFAEMNGLSAGEHIGKRVRDLVPDLGDAAEELAREVVETGEPILDIEIQGETPAQPGVMRYWKENWWPLKDDRGRVIAINIVAEEITERKEAEETLRESEEKFRVALRSSPTAVYQQDVNLRYTWVYQPHPHFTPEGLLGKRDEDVLDPRDAAPITALKQRVLYEQRPLREDVVIQVNGNPFYYTVSVEPLYDANGSLIGLSGASTDVTERKRVEEALVRHAQDLTRLQGELEVSNREANLYLDILTHDIGNTENVSNLYADLLVDKLDGEAAGYMEKLQRSINKSIEILGTVSTIRRIHQTSSELKSVDLNAVVQGVIENYPGSIFCDNGAQHQVQADDLLSVIFNNLIGNAVKHSGPDVEVAVRVGKQNGEVLVTVEDTGPGVPDDHKTEIFHRYEQHKRGVGEGLGLYLVQILVERYGGKIWVDDRVPGRPECGAAFRFTLRKAQDA